MIIRANGESLEIEDSSTVKSLLKKLDIPETRIAVELNKEVISRSKILETVLQDGDEIEIVKAIGGG
ncbi:MAG: sulfur carrier protein ThiS [SAR86 cluster bacterium]|jgi:sulfur carrier protein|nr:sulfur carrier protein ThiS [SAR86 cluster bacterium]